MELMTFVDIARPPFLMEPGEKVLFVGSCFADNIGRRFAEEQFRATVNPYGVMYNPASILHTVERCPERGFKTAFFTLGTNHVYVEKATGEIVDNCRKRPQSLFQERLLSIDECAHYLSEAIRLLRERNTGIRVVLTVSPIRYAKYGYHGSKLSKATLLLAADQLVNQCTDGSVTYFPAYEIVNDELRDYRFYKPDMLHPSEQTVEYIWQKLSTHYFSERTLAFLEEWRHVKEALNHRPFHPESEKYKLFLEKTKEKAVEVKKKYGID